MRSFWELAGSPQTTMYFPIYLVSRTGTNAYLWFSTVQRSKLILHILVQILIFLLETPDWCLQLYWNTTTDRTVILKTQMRNACDFQVSKLMKGWYLQLLRSIETVFSGKTIREFESARASRIWYLLKFWDFVPQVTLNRICIRKHISVYIDVCWF